MAIIDKPDLHFNTLTWTGDGSSSRDITGVGFQPDLVWGKCRNSAVSHAIYDSVRGASNLLSSNSTSAEGSNPALNAFISDGFTVNSDSYLNLNANTYVGWNWKAGGTAVSNTDGSITSSVSANTTSGFSIVSWVGNQTAGASCGHGLGVAPSMIIKRRRNGDGADYWYVYHKSLGNSNSIYLNATDASGASGAWNSQTPTSSVFYHGSSIRENGGNMIAYCFADVKGFSKFGSYTGNGSTDGTFVYTGFKPAFVMLKSSSSGAVGWITHDNKRIGFNPNNYYVEPNNSNAESADTDKILLLSNGFKLISTSTSWNASGGTYIYLAIAEQPFVTSTTNGSIPATAR
jgi:hypothetical protein